MSYENILFADAYAVNGTPQGSRYVNSICPRHLCREDEILYGVGFGFDFFRKISPDFEHKKVEPFQYHERSGAMGRLPKTGKFMFDCFGVTITIH
ncbi:unnamed protein product [Schistosoma curassoni]|uniref:B30.2/SPRY domain-containing protein n=1 Tax=Schistosoma curassoni TaxID=6186 RepID=A0A183K4P8_9TREM|nr:unnamed protein product [Schistosoma curassoni]